MNARFRGLPSSRQSASRARHTVLARFPFRCEPLESRWLLAGIPTLVADINASSASSYPANLTALGDRVFFSAATNADTDPTSSANGGELFVSDGTVAGTGLVKDIRPSPLDSSPWSFVGNGSTLFFTADDGVHGFELWKSDGTEAGTVLVKDLSPGTTDSFPIQKAALPDGRMIFFASSSAGNLWVTDGTELGTQPIGVQYGEGLVTVGNQAFFTVDRVLYRTDGTSAGTQAVAGPFDAPLAKLRQSGNLLYFVVDKSFTASPDELWRSDGTPAGTFALTDLPPNEGDVIELNGTAIFQSWGPDTGTRLLWRSDGTVAGTMQISAQLRLQHDGLHYSQGAILNGQLFFRAFDSVTNASGVWKTDGTTAGTALAWTVQDGDGSSYPSRMIGAENQLFLLNLDTRTSGLWVNDGLSSQRTFLHTVAPGGSPSYATVGNRLFFAIQGYPGEQELWTSDGTPAGTTQIDVQTATVGSSATQLVSAGGTLFLKAEDGDGTADLWSASGVGAQVVPGGVNANPTDPVDVGGTLFFAHNNGQLWSSNGVSAAPVVLPQPGSYRGNLTAGGERALYRSLDSSGHRWSASDGNSIEVLPPFSPLGSSAAAYLDGQFLFAGGNTTINFELWKSDGTAAGTMLLKEIRSGTLGSNPTNLTTVGNLAFFTANDAVAGFELWKSDGTSGGTTLVKNIAEGLGSSFPHGLFGAGEALYFTALGGSEGYALWRSDGTAVGTTLVYDFRADGADPNLAEMTDFGGTLLFVADDGVHGPELWTSDGTPAGTVLLADVLPGSAGSAPTDLTVLGGLVYFSADDGVHGRELWQTDGTPAGTVLVSDLQPGAGGSDPAALEVHEAELYFVADEGLQGRELWRLASSTVAGRHVFYNNSTFDGDDAAASAGDDAAVAPDKQALLPGQTASFANYTSYARGLNGLMVDVAGLAGSPTADDFEFRVGNDNSPGNWPVLAAAPQVSVRPGAGVSGTDRVTLVWPSGAVQGAWLQVTVKTTGRIGLADDDVFYFGNAVGETGNSTSQAVVNAADEIGTRVNPVGPFPTAPPTNVYDFNRDRLVNATDQIIARTHSTNPLTALRLIAPPASAGSAAALVGGDATLAALAQEVIEGGPSRRRRR